MTDHIAYNDYGTLRSEVVRLLQEGKLRAEQALAQETLRTYHAIGGVLDRYLLEHRDRAGYGEQTVVRLAEDAKLSKTLLYQAVAFFRLQPIFHARGKLTWTHYRALLSVPTVEAQRLYEQAAIRNGWSVRELDSQMKAGAFEDGGPATTGSGLLRLRGRKPFRALRGDYYTYRLVNGSGDLERQDLRLDLGFGILVAWPVPEGLRGGDFLRVSRDGSGNFTLKQVEGRRAAFYTYRARVLDVIDGDTIWLDIDCGFRVWSRQKVRLRGIDAPELPTPEGLQAKDFVARALSGLPFVAVTTTKPDKYDRYLADVFYQEGETDAEAVLEKGQVLNRELLSAGLVEEYRKGK